MTSLTVDQVEQVANDLNLALSQLPRSSPVSLPPSKRQRTDSEFTPFSSSSTFAFPDPSLSSISNFPAPSPEPSPEPSAAPSSAPEQKLQLSTAQLFEWLVCVLHALGYRKWADQIRELSNVNHRQLTRQLLTHPPVDDLVVAVPANWNALLKLRDTNIQAVRGYCGIQQCFQLYRDACKAADSAWLDDSQLAPLRRELHQRQAALPELKLEGDCQHLLPLLPQTSGALWLVCYVLEQVPWPPFLSDAMSQLTLQLITSAEADVMVINLESFAIALPVGPMFASTVSLRHFYETTEQYLRRYQTFTQNMNKIPKQHEYYKCLQRYAFLQKKALGLLCQGFSKDATHGQSLGWSELTSSHPLHTPVHILRNLLPNFEQGEQLYALVAP